MSFINWSDPDEMLGLLAEYIVDEHAEEQSDRQRARFLKSLSQALTALATAAPSLSPRQAIDRLQAIRDSQPAEFNDDPALTHVDDCIQELERIAAGRS